MQRYLEKVDDVLSVCCTPWIKNWRIWGGGRRAGYKKKLNSRQRCRSSLQIDLIFPASDMQSCRSRVTTNHRKSQCLVPVEINCGSRSIWITSQQKGAIKISSLWVSFGHRTLRCQTIRDWIKTYWCRHKKSGHYSTGMKLVVFRCAYCIVTY